MGINCLPGNPVPRWPLICNVSANSCHPAALETQTRTHLPLDRHQLLPLSLTPSSALPRSSRAGSTTVLAQLPDLLKTSRFLNQRQAVCTPVPTPLLSQSPLPLPRLLSVTNDQCRQILIPPVFHLIKGYIHPTASISVCMPIVQVWKCLLVIH